MAKPMIEKTTGYDAVTGGWADAYSIRVGGKRGKRWAPEGAPDGAYATFPTRARAEHFISDGGLIVVEKVRLEDALAAAGWLEDEGYSDENTARFKAWADANGVYLYARPREQFFPSIGVVEAQRLGLSKIVMEDLS